ncbi:hypothetical protein AQUSIP_10650 [Aquicella siphonis]|uniref:Phosphatidylinositol diacylglycerol-lyase n=1 Tax=Aquicella siphonis TaxID=254247 RepID=A0A5E4PHH4_9COXI|nr:hypothetical protein [Aquicella siphonis]VVC75771.1 hypothetical protein AQUSIP_10650 [Aquicella siphonis]
MPPRMTPAVYLSLAVCLIYSAPVTAAPVPDNTRQANSPSWTSEALRLQREIDLHAPLNEATFIGTHNSYNSRAYEIPLVRYVDPNHTLSIYGQLEAGIRSIELDAHWTLTKRLSKDILLCHGQANHIGCGAFDRNITEGLAELRDWLKNNPNEIVLLYIERHLDGHEPRLAARLDQFLGDFIFKPASVRPKDNAAKSCVPLPSSLTKADILSTGKQLIIMVRGCDGDNPRYEEQTTYKQIWNDLVFAGAGTTHAHPYDWYESKIGDFSPYPDCSKSTLFATDYNHKSLWRFFEDRTRLSSVLEPQKKLETSDMRELMRCGINWPTMDMLTANDPRLRAAIWSWAPDYPHEGQGQCTKYEAGTGIKNIACEEPLPAFACRDTTSGSWTVVNSAADWSSGNTLCPSLAGKTWRFAAPVNGSQMEALKLAMNNQGITEVGLNYKEVNPGHWIAG